MENRTTWCILVMLMMSGLKSPATAGAQRIHANDADSVANLTLAIDPISRLPLISRDGVVVQNLGGVRARFSLKIRLLDSAGQTLFDERIPSQDSVFELAARGLGGGPGRHIPFDRLSQLQAVVDSLLAGEREFGMRVSSVRESQETAESKVLGVREWRSWRRLTPDSTYTFTFGLRGPGRSVLTTSRTSVLRSPRGVLLSSLSVTTSDEVDEAAYRAAVKVRTPPGLAHGQPLTLHVSADGEVRGGERTVYEMSAIYDTIAPLITSYRAILLPRGQVAIQVQGSDRESGIEDNGVVTKYSRDGGKSWVRVVHRHFDDDFGRAAVFEALIGPFSPSDSLMIGLVASDRAGNKTEHIPIDARVFMSPSHWQAAMFGASSSRLPNPLFDFEALGRLSEQCGVSDDSNQSISGVRDDLDRSVEFERRRCADIERLVDPLRTRRGQVTLPTSSRAEFLVDSPSGTQQVLHIPWWRDS